MVYPPKNEILDLTGLTLKVDDVLLTGGGTMSFSTFRPDSTGTNDVTDRLVEAITEASIQKRPLVIPYAESGTYSLDKEHVLLQGLTDVTIIFEPGVTLYDRGRSYTGVPSGTTFNLPWGIEFVDCTNVMWIGGTYRSSAAKGGSSSNQFNIDTYEQRKPLVGFYQCNNVLLHGMKRWGPPARGIAGTNRDAILIALGIEETISQNDWAYWAGRNHWVNFFECNDVRMNLCLVEPDTSDKEAISFIGCTNMSWTNELSWSEGQNMASLGKVIRTNNFYIAGHRVKDTSDSSLMDIIGSNGLIENIYADIPNGKSCDISHEWAYACTAFDRVTVRNFITTGRPPVCAVVSSTQAQVEASPINDIVIDNVRANIGATDFSESRSISFSTVASYKVINYKGVNESPSGSTFAWGGGQNVKFYDCEYEWTLSSVSLNTGNRNCTANVGNEYHNCHFTMNASQAGTDEGLATWALAGPHTFFGGSITDASLSVGAGAVATFYGVKLTDFAISGAGTYTFIGCTLDGLPYDTVPTEYADDAAAASGGVPIGGTYRTASALKIRVS